MLTQKLTGTASTSRLGWFATAVLANLLLIASAKIQVPFWPVPMTMQTAAILAVGMGFGARGALLVVGAYLVEGALGLPVFAGTPERGLGLAYMAGPTGGYLLGFLVAAVLTGWAAERGWLSSFWKAAAGMVAGHALILTLGALWLGIAMGWDAAWRSGVEPFLLGTLFKAGLGAALFGALGTLRAWLEGSR